MNLTDKALDELIRYHTLGAARSNRSAYGRQVEVETLAALEELKKLRAGIPCEGTVS